jgi:spore coat protein CotF
LRVSTVLTAVTEATGLKPDDKIIAQGLLQMGKTKALAMCAALCESATPEVRHILQTQLQDCLEGHERMTKLAQKRGWYKADETAEDQLKQAVKLAKPVVQ